MCTRSAPTPRPTTATMADHRSRPRRVPAAGPAHRLHPRRPRRHPELDAAGRSVDRRPNRSPLGGPERRRSSPRSSFAAPTHDRREQFDRDSSRPLPDRAIDEPLTEFLVHVAAGWHQLASSISTGRRARRSRVADHASRAQPDPWWVGGGLARPRLVEAPGGDPMAAISDATICDRRSARVSNWAEHGMAWRFALVANTRSADSPTPTTTPSRRSSAPDAPTRRSVLLVVAVADLAAGRPR